MYISLIETHASYRLSLYLAMIFSYAFLLVGFNLFGIACLSMSYMYLPTTDIVTIKSRLKHDHVSPIPPVNRIPSIFDGIFSALSVHSFMLFNAIS